jgi:hypothetical protein
MEHTATLCMPVKAGGTYSHQWASGSFKYRVFQKERFNFKSLNEFIQTTRTAFWTVILQRNEQSFSRDSYGSV